MVSQLQAVGVLDAGGRGDAGMGQVAPAGGLTKHHAVQQQVRQPAALAVEPAAPGGFQTADHGASPPATTTGPAATTGPTGQVASRLKYQPK